MLATGCAGEPEGSSVEASSRTHASDTAKSAPDTSDRATPSDDGQWNMSLLEDQQLAGVIMREPGGIAYLIAALAFAASWLEEREPLVIRP